MRNSCRGEVGNFILIPPLCFLLKNLLEISCIYFAWQDCVAEVILIFFLFSLAGEVEKERGGGRRRLIPSIMILQSYTIKIV